MLRRCQDALPSWREASFDDFEFDAPKGFSSFTMGVRARHHLDPPAVLYRHLAGKENAILDAATEKATFLLLGDAGIAAQCLHYGDDHRIETFYRGRTLTAHDVLDPTIQLGVANELYRLHQLEPVGLPERTFFELLHEQWGELARPALGPLRSTLPPDEQALCDDLLELFEPETLDKVRRCLPESTPVFCHNDTYHGNVFLLDDGSVRLLDFEFSCLNHPAFDFANLFAETVMEHGLAEPPHFRINEPAFTDDHLRTLIGCYLENRSFDDDTERTDQLELLLAETKRALMLSDYMYAMAALPLALEPIQKIRFIPYAHQRFAKFLASWADAFGDTLA